MLRRTLKHSSLRRRSSSYEENLIIAESVKSIAPFKAEVNTLVDALSPLLVGSSRIMAQAGKIKTNLEKSSDDLDPLLEEEVGKIVAYVTQVGKLAQATYKQVKATENAIEDLYDLSKESREKVFEFLKRTQIESV